MLTGFSVAAVNDGTALLLAELEAAGVAVEFFVGLLSPILGIAVVLVRGSVLVWVSVLLFAAAPLCTPCTSPRSTDNTFTRCSSSATMAAQVRL